MSIIHSNYSFKKAFWQILLLALPTAYLGHYVLRLVNDFYAINSGQTIMQAIVLALGIIVSVLLYGTKAFRFLSTFIVVLLLGYVFRWTVGNVAIDGIDTFLWSIKVFIFTILFTLGWVIGFGFCRWRLFSVVWALVILSLFVFMASTGQGMSFVSVVTAYFPLLFYSIYILFASELLRRLDSRDPKFATMVLKKTGNFVALFALLLFLLFTVFQKSFLSVEKKLAESKFDRKDKGSMTKQNSDGSLSNTEGMRLDGGLNKGKQLLFVAHLQNFMADSTTPNPLYFTSTYYTRFDEATQTFETDSLKPFNDLFSPDPAAIPLYFSESDSNAIANGKSTLARRVVTTEVYKTLLSPHSFVAPSTAFFCQPIPVPNDNAQQFKSAYRAKMWVSDLNSAYFIYNPAGNAMLQQFQEARFAQLRQQNDYSKEDKKFVSYYTTMPPEQDYKRIGELAKRITASAPTVIDKMLAIRNYFLSKDANGMPLYQYSDNPGIPGLPSASKLNYFLFENRKGYCAYFAGATLFMLRSLGIPSRVAAGFMTIDRSSKNPGWYWFYADQAHAWTQVFFPEYGWIDFDTTIPDVNTQQSPQPDGTPPLGQLQSYFVADGTIESIDLPNKTIHLNVGKMLIGDRNFSVNPMQNITMDIALAKIATDTGSVDITALQPKMHVTTASSDESLKAIKPSPADSTLNILAQIRQPVPIDEIKIISDVHKEKEAQSSVQDIIPQRATGIIFWIIVVLLLLTLLLPAIIWQSLRWKGRRSKFYNYKAILYYLHLIGYSRDEKAPLVFAEQIDKRFGTDFKNYSILYQKWKYSPQKLNAKEEVILNGFSKKFIKAIHTKIPLKQRIRYFLHPAKALDFFF